MTTDVTSAPANASIAEVAAILTERDITGVPIVNQFDIVVGVVSWTDLRRTIDPDELEGGIRGGWMRRDRPVQVRWPDQAAIEVMSGPPITVGPDASLAVAGRRMHRYNIGRLLVTDADNHLLGIITRRDLLKVHARLDSVILDEVAQRILRRILVLEPSSVDVAVDDGVVTLVGHVARKSTVLAAVGLTQAVAGVTEVVDRLTFDTDDITRTPAPQPPALDAMHGWWDGRRHDTPPTGGTRDTTATGIAEPAPFSSPEHPVGIEFEEPSRDSGGTPSGAATGALRLTGDIVDEWGRQSFPASDPPTNW
ncbi:HPP family protein [Micromonospora sp. NPDC049282]|uniref:CBS domain-containing protein n=1 Tax=Micromonospora sp. NPDC049282 TaxID=3364269 RepID=UPI00371330DB